MQEVEVKCWAAFETELHHLSRLREDRESKNGRKCRDPLFRGLADSRWLLETTLERSFPMERSDEDINFLKYYRKAAASKPAIATLAGKKWDGVPDYGQFKSLLNQHKDAWLDRFLSKQPAVYEYLIYLRHHGFPSPLLDWTASPYIAALFAFDAVPKCAERVAICAFLQGPAHQVSPDQQLFTVGSYVQSHPRHFLQQSDYSMCVKLEDVEYFFSPHEQAMSEAVGPGGMCFKFVLPVGERLAALKQLDQMNVNPFSLFGSEDSLVRTIARRECLFKSWEI